MRMIPHSIDQIQIFHQPMLLYPKALTHQPIHKELLLTKPEQRKGNHVDYRHSYRHIITFFRLPHQLLRTYYDPYAVNLNGNKTDSAGILNWKNCSYRSEERRVGKSVDLGG